MKNLLLTVISVSTVFANSMAASAQVEPRLAGEWQLEPGPDQETRTLHVDGSGKYQTVSNGQVLDSGTITLYDGTWKLKANSGYSDTGRFSVVCSQRAASSAGHCAALHIAGLRHDRCLSGSLAAPARRRTIRRPVTYT